MKKGDERMKKILLVVVLMGLLVISNSGIASAATFIFAQNDLLKFWDVAEIPQNSTTSLLLNSASGSGVGISATLYDDVLPGAFAQMLIGVNATGTSATGSGATVANVGASDLSLFSTYGLTFTNTDDDVLSVNLFLDTLGGNHYEGTQIWLTPGATGSVTLSLTGKTNLSNVEGIGFILGSNMIGSPTHPSYDANYPSNPDTLSVHVQGGIPEPATMSLLGLGLLGAAGARFRRKKK
ncbi:PEP-CTERM sorting domain-containing protein [Candidatus Omnitrophota bacterium]